MATHHDTAAVGHAEFAPPEAWDAIAAAYDEFVAPGEAELSTQALRLVGLQPGETFLDVACGPGGLGLAAAKLGAAVVAVDWAPGMVARFEARVREAGHPEAAALIMDAHALDLADDRFDVTGSQFGVMLVPDQLTALREMVRVTKPGGRVLLVAYGPPTQYEALQYFISAVQSVVPEFKGLPEPPPLEFQVSDPAVLADRLTAAGLTDVRVDTGHQEQVRFRTGEEAWNWMRGGNPIVDMILSELTRHDQLTVRQVLDGLIRERADRTGVAILTASLNLGWGRKPGHG